MFKHNIETPYHSIDIRLYIAFDSTESLEAFLEASELLEEEKKGIHACISNYQFANKRMLVLCTSRKPGGIIPANVFNHAAAVYEIYPSEHHFNVRKSCGIDLSDALHNFGYDMAVYQGRLVSLVAVMGL